LVAQWLAARLGAHNMRAAPAPKSLTNFGDTTVSVGCIAPGPMALLGHLTGFGTEHYCHSLDKADAWFVTGLPYPEAS